MPTIQPFSPSELPASHEPYGTQWIIDRLTAIGYSGVLIYKLQEDPKNFYIHVKEDHVSKNQLAFDMSPTRGYITIGATLINVEPGTAKLVEIVGPVNETVKVRFSGIGFISQRSFVMPQTGRFNFQFGPCPSNMAVTEPQTYHFYVDGIDIAPAAVKVTFR